MGAGDQAGIEVRNMPPWHIARGVGITKFKDDPSLSDAEIAMIARWVELARRKGIRPTCRRPFSSRTTTRGRSANRTSSSPLWLTSIPAQGSDWWGNY